MKTTIRIEYSENTKAVLASTKYEVELENESESQSLSILDIQRKAKDIFQDAQNYALNQTKMRL